MSNKGGNKMEYIDPRLEYILHMTRDISNVVYYKSPTEVVLKRMNSDAMDKPVIISIKDFSSDDGPISEKKVKNIVIDKMRDFGFLSEHNCTAMSLGHIGLFSFVDGPSIRMDVKELTDDTQLELIQNTEGGIDHIIPNPAIRDIAHFLNWAFNKTDNRFSISIPIQNKEDSLTFYLWYWLGIWHGLASKTQIFKVTLSQTHR